MVLSFNSSCIYTRLVCDESVNCVCICMVLFAAQFTVQPVSVIQAQGLIAVFECRYLGVQSHNWRLNGDFPTDDNYPSDVTVTPPSGDTPATLTIPATAQYNNTVVQCGAVVRDGRGFIPELSVNATLQVQGSHNQH